MEYYVIKKHYLVISDLFNGFILQKHKKNEVFTSIFFFLVFKSFLNAVAHSSNISGKDK